MISIKIEGLFRPVGSMSTIEVNYQSDITNICIKIHTIIIQAKGDISIIAKKDDFIGMDMQDHNVRFIFKNIRYRLVVPYGDKKDIINNQISELVKILLDSGTENKVDLYKGLKDRLDEVDSRADDAESEIAELREKCIMLEETVKKMKAKAKAVKKLSRDINHVEADLLGLNA